MRHHVEAIKAFIKNVGWDRDGINIELNEVRGDFRGGYMGTSAEVLIKIPVSLNLDSSTSHPLMKIFSSMQANLLASPLIQDQLDQSKKKIEKLEKQLKKLQGKKK